MIGTDWRNSFSVRSNKWYTWKFPSHTILIKFIYSVSFLMLRAETAWKALPHESHSWGSFLEWILWCMWDVNCHTRQTRRTLCTNFAQSHFYAFDWILRFLLIRMPQRSVVSGCRFACQAGAEETNSPQSEELHFLSWQGFFHKAYSEEPSKTSIRSTSMLMVNYGVLQLWTHCSRSRASEHPGAEEPRRARLTMTQLRFALGSRGMDATWTGFHEQPEPGFFKERVFGWLLEGRAPATDPGQPWGPPRGWRAGQKREAQVALDFLKHSRGLREASARLRLRRGPRGSIHRRGSLPLQNSRRCARSPGPRRLRALRASRGRVSAVASEPSAAAHWPQHTFRAFPPPPPDLLDASAGNAGGPAPELQEGRGWSQSQREARDSLLRRMEVWSGAEAPAAPTRWLPLKPSRPLGSSGRSANSWWRVSFRCFLRDKLKLYLVLSG